MTRAARPRVLFDVTQYVRSPATAGIQRVMRRLATDWRGDAVEARYGFLERGHYVSGPINRLGSVIGSTFRSAETGLAIASDVVSRPLRRAASESVSAEEVGDAFDAYLLPEPTFCEDSVTVAESVGRAIPTFFIYYDALPLTHPQFFGPRFADALAAYHRAVVRSDNVGFISQASLHVFENRLARRNVANAIVVRPGADGLRPRRHVKQTRPTFAIHGSVEPRKRHAVVIEAFERLWAAGRDYGLVVMGAPGWGQPRVIERIRELAQTPRVQWLEKPGDDDIARVLAGSAALVYTPHAEGYGLPPLEALAAGCPVIVSADLPSLEGLAPAGQVRLSTVSADRIASAVEMLAAPDANARFRREISELDLPRWNRFTSSVEHWLAETISPGRRASLETSLA
jgi:glycosyltransferase involved in cell wall biosynthesis